jgi:hypothetical protein
MSHETAVGLLHEMRSAIAEVVALKAPQVPAQGNALGFGIEIGINRLVCTLKGRTGLPSLQGGIHVDVVVTQGVALGSSPPRRWREIQTEFTNK